MTGRIATAAFVAACGGVIVQDRVTGWLPAILMGSAAVGVIYVTLIVTLGTHPEDAAMAQRLFRRRAGKRARSAI